MRDPYFAKQPPKSIGKEYYLALLKRTPLTDYNPEDVQATCLALTAQSIILALSHGHLALETVLICGGGAHNSTLLQTLKDQLKPINVLSTAEAGVDPDFIEAMMFAWLAEKTLSKTPVDLTQITGARKPTLLGAIYLGGS